VIFLPAALFAVGLRPLPAFGVIAGCIGSWMLVMSRFDLLRTFNPSRMLLCASAGLLVSLLGGQGRFFYAPPDWLIRDAVLADLVQHGFPVVYRHDNV
jgi:hypothetical protein